MARGVKYTNDQINWLRQNGNQLLDVMVVKFNERFNTKISSDGIRKICKKYGINYTVNKRIYTDEQIEFIKQHGHLTFEEMAEKFNKVFDTSVTGNALNVASQQRNIKKGYDTLNRHTCPIGQEREKDGYISVKVGSPSVWRYKQQLIYEEHFGPIPDGHVVIFHDGNRQNYDPNNLVAVKREEALWLGCLRYNKQHEEIKPALLNLVRLNQAIKERMNGEK
jgi:hypothetical protein